MDVLSAGRFAYMLDRALTEQLHQVIGETGFMPILLKRRDAGVTSEGHGIERNEIGERSERAEASTNTL